MAWRPLAEKTEKPRIMLVAWVEPDFVELEICIIEEGMGFK